MEAATASAVLGDFADVSVGSGTSRTRFFRDGDAFRVQTIGRDGRPAVFGVSFTFGVYPLQQYLISLPDGRMQVLDLSWDARPAAQGGQRWFRPLEAAPPGSPLHWTGRAMNWNFACAPCHSTGIRPNYDAARDRFATTWTDVNVACEACHGPGSGHVAWANGQGAPDRTFGFRHPLGRQDVPRFGAPSAAQPIALRIFAGAGGTIGDVCFPCHARREQIVAAPEPGGHFLDGYRPALLDPALYEPDGQDKAEDFEFGAFAQSRMARAGVTCVNCHDAHDLSLRSPGNGVCAQCHRAAAFDTAAHTHHAAGSAGGRCTACHMPQRTYMGIHVRHDHGFRLPRPTLADIGVSNGCSGCHADRSAAWLADTLGRWGQMPRPTGFADAFAAARDGAPADTRLTAALGDVSLPAIVRGTAASLLSDTRAPHATTALAAAAQDGDALVRLGAARALSTADAPARAAIGARLLKDPRRAVRLEAAAALADLPAASLPAGSAAPLQAATVELRAALETWLDRPETRTDYGSLLVRLGLPEQAEAQFQGASRLAPDFTAARIDLADLRRAMGDEAGSQAILSAAARSAPDDPAVLQALALSDVRRGDRAAAVDLLTSLASSRPADSDVARLTATALVEAGRRQEAGTVLQRALQAMPRDLPLLALQDAFELSDDARQRAARLQSEDGVPSR